MSRTHRLKASTYIDEHGVARRTFRARGSFVDRCESCLLPRLNCLCPYTVTTTATTEIWLIMHPYESYKPTNTGRLIQQVLPSTRIFQWARTAPDAHLLRLLESERYQPYLVFPDDQADYAERVVTRLEVAAPRTPVFIILDGTWRQARRMFRQSPYLAELPILSLRTNRTTRYSLRTPASPDHLCTAEVAAEVLNQAGDQQASAILNDYFDAFNACYAASRRHQKLDVPTAAMQRLLLRESHSNG